MNVLYVDISLIVTLLNYSIPEKGDHQVMVRSFDSIKYKYQNKYLFINKNGNDLHWWVYLMHFFYPVLKLY